MTIHLNESIRGLPFFCSWSGGKDSCLALHHAIRGGGEPRALLTMLAEDGRTSRSHALPRMLVEAQASRLGLPAVFRPASWQRYEAEFSSALQEFRKSGIKVGVFGDIDVEAHREWVNRVCRAAGIMPVLPLWQRDRRELLKEFFDLGYSARIIVLNERLLDKRFLGRTLESTTCEELEKAGVDPCGELGEYHTVVTGGPVFSSNIEIKTAGREYHDGYWFLKVIPLDCRPDSLGQAGGT
ncbi:MAG: diphthine--ammonia ligase [Desulfobulbaceae bacterium]|nr:diphthine--ammonia ligase [Desulfobulbaceae bacterium]MDY0351019.1 diphthine--ammonia ligase [Desulfobulbaceae bacterium]